MKKIITAIGISSVLALSAFGHEMEIQEEKSDFYIAVKGIVTLGDSIDEGETKLEGGLGKGIGIDLGYEVSHGFSVEVDGTYAVNTVTETDLLTAEQIDYDASYITSSLDIAYRYMATQELGLVVKGGYEYEFENISGLGDTTSSGFVYAAAITYEVAESIAVLAEYEVTTIKGPRGNSAFVGVEYSF